MLIDDRSCGQLMVQPSQYRTYSLCQLRGGGGGETERGEKVTLVLRNEFVDAWEDETTLNR